jgi:hypothetical protein
MLRRADHVHHLEGGRGTQGVLPGVLDAYSQGYSQGHLRGTRCVLPVVLDAYSQGYSQGHSGATEWAPHGGRVLTGMPLAWSLSTAHTGGTPTAETKSFAPKTRPQNRASVVVLVGRMSTQNARQRRASAQLKAAPSRQADKAAGGKHHQDGARARTPQRHARTHARTGLDWTIGDD